MKKKTHCSAGLTNYKTVYIFYMGLHFWKSTARKIFAVKAKVKENDVVIVEDNDKTDVNQGIKHTLSIYLASFYCGNLYLQIMLFNFNSIQL